MSAATFVPVGRVVKTHGLLGEVSVAVAAGLPFERLEGVEVHFVPPRTTVRSAVVVSVRPGPKGPLVRFEGVDDIETAASLRGATIVAAPGDVPEIPAGPEEDIGLLVTDESRGELGTVTDVIVTGANDVWVIEGERFGQVLIPVIDDVVLEIDEDARTASVRLLPGLIEDD